MQSNPKQKFLFEATSDNDNVIGIKVEIRDFNKEEIHRIVFQLVSHLNNVFYSEDEVTTEYTKTVKKV